MVGRNAREQDGKPKKVLTAGQKRRRMKKALAKPVKVKKPPMPPRTWNREKPRGDAVADEVLKITGGRGVDTRDVRHIDDNSTDLIVSGTTDTLKVRCALQPDALSAFAYGLGAAFLRRGSQGYSIDARTYSGVQAALLLLQNAGRGEFPQAMNLPGWFWTILKSMMPKNTKFKTGDINIAWDNIGLSGSVNPVVTMQQASYVYAMVFGEVIDVTLDDWPTIAPSFSVTPEVALEAIQDLFTVLPSHNDYQKRTNEPETASEFEEHETSSFCQNFSEIGSSALSLGGLATTLYSEKFINRPILGKFAPYQGSALDFRAAWEYHKSGGSPVYLAGRALEFSSKFDFNNKVSPFFRFYNFDEYWIQLNAILAGALENSESPTTCPISALEAQILLRQELLRNFNNDLAFDLRADDPNFVALIPFQVGTNGYVAGNSVMKLPTFFVESVRAASRHQAVLQAGQVVDYIPVLSRPNPQIIPQPGGFSYGPINTPIFSTVAGEVPIDLIDLHGTNAQSQTVYIYVNGERYNGLMSEWNKWITSLSATLTGLMTIGGEKGIRALSLNVWSEQQKFVPPQVVTVVNNVTAVNAKPKLEKKLSQKSFGAGTKISKVRTTIPDPVSQIYSSVFSLRTGAVFPPMTPIWKYVSLMVRPAWIITEEQDTASDQFLRGFYCEVKVIESGSVQIGQQSSVTPNILDRLLNAAALDVKAFVTESLSEMEQDMMTLASRGRGGLFTGLASMFGDAIGVPAIGQVAKAIGEVTGL